MKMYIAINPNSKKTLLHMYRWDNNNGGMMEIKKLVFILFVQSQQVEILFSIVQ